MSEIVIPSSHEAENYVLGSILIEENLVIEFCGLLNESDFHDNKNKLLYKAIKSLYNNNESVSVITVIEKLKSQGNYQYVNENYLLELTNSIPTVINIGDYIKTLREKSLQRELYYEMNTIGNKILSNKDGIGEILAYSEKRIKDIADKQSSDNMQNISASMESVFSIINANRGRKGSLIGLDTGYDALNELTMGFQPGELIILAARPGIGKSALALNIGRLMASKINAHIAFFSLEMSREQIMFRLLSMASNVPLKKIRSGDLNETDATKLLGGRVALDSLHFYLDLTASNNLEDLKIQCRKMKRDNKLDFIIIDYLQLLNANKENKGRSLSKYEEVSIISRSLKLLALELNVPILALSQLSRAPEQRKKENGEPVLSDLRDSGSIEQDADIVLFLHPLYKPKENENNYPVDLKIEKNRQGQQGRVHLFFRGDCTLFESVEGKK